MNPILTNIISGIEQHVSKPNLPAYHNVVLAGKKILFDPTTHANMELVKNPASRKDPVNTISQGVAGLMYLMYLQSKQKMPIEVLIMAAITMMCEVYDFAETGLGVQVTPDGVANTTQQLAELLFRKLGITPEQLNHAIAVGHQEIQDHQAKQAAAQGGMMNPNQPMPQGA